MRTRRHVTVLLADDNASIREALRTLLEKDGRIRVVGEARNGQEAVEMALKTRPDIVLMDISMPVMNGLDATRHVLAGRPSVRILMFSAHVDGEYVKRAKAVGAAGYIAKQMSAETLIWAIHEVAAGHRVFDPIKAAGEKRRPAGRSRTKKPKGERLTPRESAVLGLMAEGVPKTQIAARLGVGNATVERHFAALMAKLKVPSIANLAAYALASGYVENDVDLVIT